jgi:SP family arabinose:H+ symporter-like MFS transporter
VISALFPYIAAASSSLPFLFFSAMMILQFLIVLRYFPETKGMSLEQLDHMLGQTTEDEGLQGEVRW